MKCYHFVGNAPYYTNCFLIITDKNNAIAIDPNAPMELYKSRLKEDSATITDILLTHGHNDHTAGIEQLLGISPNARVHIAKEDAELFGLNATDFYEDGQTIQIDDASFDIIATPGHTPGSVCIRLENMLFTGDTLFNGDVGRTDLKGGDFETLVKSLKGLCESVLDNPQVLPGHEGFSDMKTQKEANRYLNF